MLVCLSQCVSVCLALLVYVSLPHFVCVCVCVCVLPSGVCVSSWRMVSLSMFVSLSVCMSLCVSLQVLLSLSPCVFFSVHVCLSQCVSVWLVPIVYVSLS